MPGIERVAQTLRPWLGSALVAYVPAVCQTIADRLNAYSDKQELARLSQGIDSLLFMTVRDLTSGRMVVRLDDETLMRVRVSDFAVMADELLYLLMETLPQDEAHCDLLRQYAMRCGSMSALRALLLRYGAFVNEQEASTLRRITKTCHPAFRWRAWLT